MNLRWTDEIYSNTCKRSYEVPWKQRVYIYKCVCINPPCPRDVSVLCVRCRKAPESGTFRILIRRSFFHSVTWDLRFLNVVSRSSKKSNEIFSRCARDHTTISRKRERERDYKWNVLRLTQHRSLYISSKKKKKKKRFEITFLFSSRNNH